MNSFRDTGCCGFHFQEKGPNVFGLMTLSVPLLLLGGIVFPASALITALTGRFAKVRDAAVVIIKANVRLINKTPLLPKLRCSLSARFFPVSPRMAGLVYKSFNVVLLFAAWGIIIISVILIG